MKELDIRYRTKLGTIDKSISPGELEKYLLNQEILELRILKGGKWRRVR